MLFTKKISLFVLIILILPIMISAVESKYTTEVWNRFTMVDDGSDADPTISFSVEKACLIIQPKLSENIDGTFCLELFSANAESSYHGAGLKMKYAYLNFNNIIPLPETKLSAGLLPVYFGNLYTGKYKTITGDAADIWGYSPATDYGFALSGKVPAAKLSYNLGMYNGEGYKKSKEEVNNEFAFLGNIRVKPLPMIELGGTFNFKTNENPNDASGEENLDHQNITSYAGIAKLNLDGIYVLGQFLGSSTELDNVDNSEDINTQTISFMPVYKIAPLNLEVVGRYDRHDPNTDIDDDEMTLMAFGLNYYIQENLQIQANYNIKSFEDEEEDDVNTAMLQLRWKFSSMMTK